MVLGGALGIKRITRIGSRNIFTIAAIGLAAYLLLSKSGQEKARGGIPLITSAGEAIGGTLEAILPLDIFGRELKGFGEGFGDFGYGINRGFANIFAPIKNFVNWASEKIGLGFLSTEGGAGGSGKALGDPASAQAQEEETVI